MTDLEKIELLREALKYVLRAHDYEGALTYGDAVLSPQIQNRIKDVLDNT